MKMNAQDLAKYFDHTLLKAQADKGQILTLCQEAREFGFYSVCVNPLWVPTAAQALYGSGVLVCTVVGFPLGATSPQAKAEETRIAREEGAGEIDMVIALGALKSGNWDLVAADITGVVKAAGPLPVKVILETCYLTEEEIIKACKTAQGAGARFVKTSTGFGSGGATKEVVALMKKTVAPALLVKASGGIRTLEETMTMIEAGADRIGASAGVAILKELAGASADQGSGY